MGWTVLVDGRVVDGISFEVVHTAGDRRLPTYWIGAYSGGNENINYDKGMCIWVKEKDPDKPPNESKKHKINWQDACDALLELQEKADHPVKPRAMVGKKKAKRSMGTKRSKKKK